MKNNFLNNNGATLLQNKNSKKTQVETRIDDLKQQEQAIITELDWWETKNEKIDDLLANLAAVEKFGTDLLSEAVKTEKEQETCDDYRLESLIKNKVEFALKFAAGREAFYQLVWQKIEFKVSQLKSQRNTLQDQLAHQERIFARMEIRRQNRVLLTCEYKNRLGCLGVYRCANCQTNYSVVNNNQAVEIIK